MTKIATIARISGGWRIVVRTDGTVSEICEGRCKRRIKRWARVSGVIGTICKVDIEHQ